MGYSFYYPPENKIFVAWNVEFFENDVIDHEASGSLEDLEIIQEDTHPYLDNSLDHEEDDQEIDEHQSDLNPIRRSTRTRHPTDRLCLYDDVEEHELRDLGEPAKYKAALLDPESDKWLNAMNVKMQSMKDNEVWELVELPPNAKTVGHKWLFKKKTNMDGAVHTYKARLVAKGFTQTLGIDYEETFSLVADIRAIRIRIAIAAFYDYEIWQIDVKTAFLNGYLNEEVYMEQIEGASTPAKIRRMQNIPYASVVGLIMYAVRCTRPDVAFAQNITSRFQQNPSDEHWIAVKNILKYLRNTKDMFLVYGGFVDWKSTKQSIFDTSSTDVEYIAAFDASKEAVWIRKFIFELGVVPIIEEPINMYCDITRAIEIAKDHGVTKGARHFRAKVHYPRETIEMDDVKIDKVYIDDNLAGPFTKALAFSKHFELTKKIGMIPASSLM
ncbi:putative retrotransposon protein [Tanacetum coccineum]